MCLPHGMPCVDVPQHLLTVTINATLPRKNNYENPKFIGGITINWIAKLGGWNGTIRVRIEYKSKICHIPNKTRWRCLCDLSVNYTVLGFMSSPYGINGSLNCSKSIGCVSVWIEWMSRVELGPCWGNGDKQNWTYCFYRAVANGITYYQKSETYKVLACSFSAAKSCEVPSVYLRRVRGEKIFSNRKV